MRKRFCQFVRIGFVICALLASGCSDFDEMKSQRAYIQAEALLQQGKELQAEQALADLVARYPETRSGTKAGKRLFQIQRQRELRERVAFAKILDSYQQVFNGYQSLYAGYPRSLAELDQSDYFFDSAYLEELIPEGYQVYLWLQSDGSGYLAWCVTPHKEGGYALESQNRQLVAFKRDEILEKLKARFQFSTSNGKLIALQTQN